MRQYLSVLEGHFEIEFYDCCELAAIDLTVYTEDSIHQQFTNGGIERAADALLEHESGKVIVLGFSVGGLIAWKAALGGLQVERLFALSSTRLRYEEKRPMCATHLYYAENDKFRPTEEWFRKLNLEMNLYSGQEHYFYSNEAIAMDVGRKIIELSTAKS